MPHNFQECAPNHPSPKMAPPMYIYVYDILTRMHGLSQRQQDIRCYHTYSILRSLIHLWSASIDVFRGGASLEEGELKSLHYYANRVTGSPFILCCFVIYKFSNALAHENSFSGVAKGVQKLLQVAGFIISDVSYVFFKWSDQLNFVSCRY